MSSTSVRNDIFKGAVWLTSFKLVERGLGIASTLILVRFLLPEDFGLVAMGMSIIVAVQLFTSFGFDVVLIQNQEATRSHYHTAWTFHVCFGLVSALGMAAMAHPIAWFYQDDRLVIIMYAIAANHFVGSLENIAIVDFRKNMQFGREVTYQVCLKVIGFCVTVPLAIITQSYWALIAGMTARSLGKVALSFAMKPMRPRFTFSRAREMFGFSAWLMVNNAIYTVIARSHDFIVGRIAGARALGLFSVSLEISNLISTELIAPINRAAFPGYAKLSRNQPQFQKTYLDIMACIMLLSVPAATGIAATAELLVPLVLGQNWLDSIPIIKVLAIYGAVFSLNTNSMYIFHALAKPKLVTRLALCQAAVLLPTMALGTTWYGLQGTAWAMLGTTALVAVPMMWFMVSRTLAMSVFRMLERLWRPAVASTIMFLGVRWVMSTHLMDDWPSFGALGTAVAVGVVIYLTVISLLWWAVGRPEGGESIIWTLIRDKAVQLVGLLSGRPTV